MPGLDRSRLAELLNQLGDEKDETALAAAREASRMVRDSGETWTDVLGDGGTYAEAQPAKNVYASDSVDKSDDLRLVERLLARRDISDTLRSDLNDFKQAIAAGKLDRMDTDYIRALARRLGA